MRIQSASLDVPGHCPNNCKFCVSEASGSSTMLKNAFVKGDYDYAKWIEREFADRLEYLRDSGINTLVLTGTGSEPHMNSLYLEAFSRVNRELKSRFKHIEIQTSGVKFTEDTMKCLQNGVGVKTVSLSISSFGSPKNAELNGSPAVFKVNIPKLCKTIKEHGFNLRLSLNINKPGFGMLKDLKDYFKISKELGADQITFRKLYSTKGKSDKNKWIEENSMSDEWWDALEKYIGKKGRVLNVLPFGAIKYSIHGLSTVIDRDCMSKGNKKDIKYLILRRNCKLYSEWDDPASLVF